MKKSLLLFIKSLFTVVIELLPSLPLFLVVAYGYGKLNRVAYILLVILVIGSYAFYLIFANTKFISLSCWILRYRLKTNDHHILRIVISNLIFYVLIFGNFWVKMEQKRDPLWNIFNFLLLIDFAACFHPKIKNRFSLYLLKIRWETPPQKTLPNDGILV